MKLTQPWVGYLDRSYQQIKSSLLSRLVVNNPEISDHNESNIFIIIISMFSGIAEMLNYYIDMMAREAFLGTAQRFTSVLRLAKLIDYNGKSATMAGVDLLFTLSNNGAQYFALAPIIIPKDTVVQDANGVIFRTLNDETISPGQSGAYSTAQQWQDVTAELLDQTTGVALQKVLLPTDYVDGTLTVMINGIQWTLFTSLGYLMSDTEGFIVIIDDDGLPYAVFGDGVNGKIPDTGFDILGSYKVTQGAAGNLQPGSINQISDTNTILPAGVTLNVTNQDYSNGGGDIEDIEQIRNRAPRYLRTLDRAVTYQDYVDTTLQVPEVGEAEVSYCCGKFVNIYVIPKTIGIATQALLQKVLDYVNCRKMITTKLNVQAAGLSRLYVVGNIFAKPLFSENAVLVEVINLLNDKYGFDASWINRKISVSDIVATIEGATTVDHFDLVSVRVLPYVRPKNPNTTLLDIAFITLPQVATPADYTIIYNPTSSQFKIYRGAKPLGAVGIGQQYTDAYVSFIINSANYQAGDQWVFHVTPSYPETFPVTQINIIDFTMPLIDIGPLLDANIPRTIYSALTVIGAQSNGSNCLPPCP